MAAEKSPWKVDVVVWGDPPFDTSECPDVRGVAYNGGRDGHEGVLSFLLDARDPVFATWAVAAQVWGVEDNAGRLPNVVSVEVQRAETPIDDEARQMIDVLNFTFDRLGAMHRVTPEEIIGTPL